MSMPPLQTERLVIRPFRMDDLDAIHHILDIELAEANTGSEEIFSRDRRERWLEWTVLNYEALADLYQPPYGDRAVVLRQTGQVIGACGYAPTNGPFEQLSALSSGAGGPIPRYNTPEFGLYWAISPAHRRQGYATEAARALIDYAFTHLYLKRVVATTSYENAASIAVMRKVGMRIETNPYPEPVWFQVVGIIENTTAAKTN